MQEVVVGTDSYIYYLEELIDGQALDAITKPLPFDLCTALGLQMCEAIECLWSKRKVHRDIKPGNIMLRADGQNFVLLEIGLALDLDGSSLTEPGNVVGTLRYLSPDQLRLTHPKRDLDFRCDLYALGLVLYECITAIHPLWNALTPRMNMHANIMHVRPLPLKDFRVDTPTGLEEIVLRLLEKEPNMRYARISHLRTDLEGVNLR
jgi:serine/threonine protein kinase